MFIIKKILPIIIHINLVNTLNDEYYESVKKEFPDVNVVRTESNVVQVKDIIHFKVFEQQEQFEYLIQVDGWLFVSLCN